jgi:hypothetical protein
MASVTLDLLERLVGSWTTVATHPAMPGVTVNGVANVEWLEGRKFLIVRATTDHPQFPDSISIIGFMDADRASEAAVAGALSMHYYDSRGVFRDQACSIDETAWRWWRNAPGWSQRFTGTFADGGATIIGKSELCEDDVEWRADLAITYRRRV